MSIVGADLSQLVGRNGEVLEALQELTRLAVYRETESAPPDARHLQATARRSASSSCGSPRRPWPRSGKAGESVSLDPMSPFERKVVHDAVAAAGLTSESEGVEPRRYVVILPGYPMDNDVSRETPSAPPHRGPEGVPF